MPHGPQIIELGRSTELARQLASDEIDEVHVRMEPLEDLFAVFRGSHRGLPFWARDWAVNDKAHRPPSFGAFSRTHGPSDTREGPSTSRPHRQNSAGSDARGRLAKWLEIRPDPAWRMANG